MRRAARRPATLLTAMPRIHPTAHRRSARAELAADVEVGPYSIVGPRRAIGAGTVIGPHVVIDRPHDASARAIASSSSRRSARFRRTGSTAASRRRTTIGDDNVIREFVTDPRRHGAGSRRHDDRQRQLVPRLHARRARLRRRQPHDVLQQRAARGPRAPSATGRCSAASSACTSSAASARTRWSPPDAIVLQDVPPFVTVAGYPAKPRGINSEGLRRRGFSRRRHRRGAARLQDALPRGPRARRCAGGDRRSSAAPRRCCAPLVEFLADARARHRPLSALACATRPRPPVTIGIVAGEASGDALAADADPRRARAPAGRALRRHRRARSMEAAGCEVVVSAGTSSRCAASSRCIAHLPELLRIARRRCAAPACARTRAALHRRRRARLQSRPRAQAEARAACAPMHFVSPSVWAWRRERMRHDRRARSIGCWRCFRSSRRSTTTAGVPVTFVGHPLAAGCRDARHAARGARAAEARAGARRCSRCCPAAACPSSRCTPSSCCETAAALLEARADARFLVPLVTRATRDAFRGAMHTGWSSTRLPITLLYGHATTRCARPTSALVASGTATLEAALARCPHVIFYRVNAVDRAASSGASCCCPTSGCPTSWPDASSCRNSCRTMRRPDNLAQAALNLYDDTVTRRRTRGAVRRLRAMRCRPIPATLAAEAVMARAARWRAWHADRGRRRSRARAARRAGRRRRGDPRSRSARSAACATRSC